MKKLRNIILVILVALSLGVSAGFLQNNNLAKSQVLFAEQSITQNESSENIRLDESTPVDTSSIKEFWTPSEDKGASFSTYSTEYTSISSAQELVNALDEGTGNYKLTCDIDLSGKLWLPITSFNGILDGDGYAIIGLTMDDRCGTDLAFILTLATYKKITNVAFKSVNINTTSSSAAVVVLNNYGTVERVSIDSGYLSSSVTIFGTNKYVNMGNIVYGEVNECASYIQLSSVSQFTDDDVNDNDTYNDCLWIDASTQMAEPINDETSSTVTVDTKWDSNQLTRVGNVFIFVEWTDVTASGSRENTFYDVAKRMEQVDIFKDLGATISGCVCSFTATYNGTDITPAGVELDTNMTTYTVGNSETIETNRQGVLHIKIKTVPEKIGFTGYETYNIYHNGTNLEGEYCHAIEVPAENEFVIPYNINTKQVSENYTKESVSTSIKVFDEDGNELENGVKDIRFGLAYKITFTNLQSNYNIIHRLKNNQSFNLQNTIEFLGYSSGFGVIYDEIESEPNSINVKFSSWSDSNSKIFPLMVTDQRIVNLATPVTTAQKKVNGNAYLGVEGALNKYGTTQKFTQVILRTGQKNKLDNVSSSITNTFHQVNGVYVESFYDKNRDKVLYTGETNPTVTYKGDETLYAVVKYIDYSAKFTINSSLGSNTQLLFEVIKQDGSVEKYGLGFSNGYYTENNITELTATKNGSNRDVEIPNIIVDEKINIHLWSGDSEVVSADITPAALNGFKTSSDPAPKDSDELDRYSLSVEGLTSGDANILSAIIVITSKKAVNYTFTVEGAYFECDEVDNVKEVVQLTTVNTSAEVDVAYSEDGNVLNIRTDGSQELRLTFTFKVERGLSFYFEGCEPISMDDSQAVITLKDSDTKTFKIHINFAKYDLITQFVDKDRNTSTINSDDLIDHKNIETINGTELSEVPSGAKGKIYPNFEFLSAGYYEAVVDLNNETYGVKYKVTGAFITIKNTAGTILFDKDFKEYGELFSIKADSDNVYSISLDFTKMIKDGTYKNYLKGQDVTDITVSIVLEVVDYTITIKKDTALSAQVYYDNTSYNFDSNGEYKITVPYGTEIKFKQTFDETSDASHTLCVVDGDKNVAALYNNGVIWNGNKYAITKDVILTVGNLEIVKFDTKLLILDEGSNEDLWYFNQNTNKYESFNLYDTDVYAYNGIHKFANIDLSSFFGSNFGGIRNVSGSYVLSGSMPSYYESLVVNFGFYDISTPHAYNIEGLLVIYNDIEVVDGLHKAEPYNIVGKEISDELILDTTSRDITIAPIISVNSFTLKYEDVNNKGTTLKQVPTIYGDPDLCVDYTGITKTGYILKERVESDIGNSYIDSQPIFSHGETGYDALGDTLILYVEYQPVSYTIKFYDINGNELTGSAYSNFSKNYGETFGTLPNGPTVNGYTFTGWRSGEVLHINEDTEIIESTSLDIVAGGLIRLYAKYTARTFNVYVLLDDSSSETLFTMTLTYDEAFTLPTLADAEILAKNNGKSFAKDGYTFIGWEHDSAEIYDGGRTLSVSEVNYFYDNDIIIMRGAWSIKSYIFSIDIYGNKLISNEISTDFYELDLDYAGVSVDALTEDNIIYNLEQGGTSISLNYGNTTQFYIAFDAEIYSFRGISLSLGSDDYELTTIDVIETTTVAHYTVYKFSTKSPITENTQYVAKLYLRKYNLTYYNGATKLTNVSPTSYYVGQTVTLPVTNTTGGSIVENYEFLGWYKELTLKTKYDESVNFDCQDVFLFGKFELSETTYAVEYYFQNTQQTSYEYQAVLTRTETGKVDEEITLALINQYVETFEHYSYSKYELNYKIIKADGTSKIKIYYDRNTYTVTLLKSEGVVVDTKTVVYGNNLSLPAGSDEGDLKYSGWIYKSYIPLTVASTLEASRYYAIPNGKDYNEVDRANILTEITNVRVNIELYIVYNYAPTLVMVTFNSNGAPGIMAAKTYIRGQSYSVPTCEFVYNGYTFSHWEASVSSAGLSNSPVRTDAAFNSLINQYNRIMLTAIWNLQYPEFDKTEISVEKVYDGNSIGGEFTITNYMPEAAYAFTIVDYSNTTTVYETLSVTNNNGVISFTANTIKDVQDTTYKIKVSVEGKSAYLPLKVKITPLTASFELNPTKVFDNTTEYTANIKVDKTNQMLVVKSNYSSANVGGKLNNSSTFTVYAWGTGTITNNYAISVTGESVIVKRPLDIDVAKKVVYNTPSISATVETGISGITVTYTLSLTNANIGTYTITNGECDIFSSAPSYVCTGSQIGNFDISLNGNIEITKATSSGDEYILADYASIAQPTDLLYSGTNKFDEVIITTSDSNLTYTLYKEVYSGTSFVSTTEAINVGRYRVRAVFSHNNYATLKNNELQVTFIVEKRAFTVKDKNNTFNKVFDNSTEYVVKEENLTIEFIGRTPTGYKFSDLALSAYYGQSDAGEASLIFECKALNYELPDNEFEVDISKKDLTLSLNKDYSKQYDNTYIALPVSNLAVNGLATGDSISVETIEVQLKDAGTYNYSSYQNKIIIPNNLVATSLDNYNVSFITSSYTLTVTAVNVQLNYYLPTFTYNSKEQKLNVEYVNYNEMGSATSNVVLQPLNEGDYKIGSGDLSFEYLSLTNQKASPVNAGNYKLKLTISSNNFVFSRIVNNGNIVESNKAYQSYEIEYEITKRHLTNIIANQSTYSSTGEKITLTNVVADGENLLDGHTIKLNYESTSSVPGTYTVDNTNANFVYNTASAYYYDDHTYTTDVKNVKITSATIMEGAANVTANYIIDNNTDFSVNIVIGGILIEGLPEIKQNQSFVFNGANQKPDISALINEIDAYNTGKTDAEKVNLTTKYQKYTTTWQDVSEYKNVGTYRIYITSDKTITGWTNSIQFQITARPITISNIANKSLDKVYDGTDVFESSKLNDQYIQVTNVSDVIDYKFEDLGLNITYSSSSVGSKLIVNITNTNYTLTSKINGTITSRALTINVGTYEAIYNRSAQNIQIQASHISGLISTHTFQGIIITEYVEVGEYNLTGLSSIDYFITNESNLAVTSNYTVTLTGTLKINKATLKIDAGDLSKIYNANGQGATIAHTYSNGMSFVAGDYTVKYNGVTALPVNAGSYAITIEVNNNFALDYTASTLVINKKNISSITVVDKVVSVNEPSYSVTYSKLTLADLVIDNHYLYLTLTAPASVGEYNVSSNDVTKEIIIKDGSGNDLTNNYDITSITYSGKITVQADSMPSDIARPTDAEVIYDGNLHSIANNFDAVISYLNSQTVAIEYYINNSKVANYSTFKNTSYQNVGTYKYEIRMNAVNIPSSISATLTIKQRAITLSNTAKSLDKVYDGTATFDSSKLTDEYIQVNNIVSGHTFEDLGLTLTYTDSVVGSSLTASITNTNYILSSVSLTGTITAREAIINVGVYETTYKRATISFNIEEKFISGLVEGHKLIGDIQVNYTEVGSYDLKNVDIKYLIDNEYIFIHDSKSNSVISNYKVSLTGTLKINKATLEIDASDLTKTYNAQSQGARITHNYSNGMSFVAGDYTVKYNGATTLPINAGSYPITIEVSGNFALDYTASSLVINKKQITAIAVGNQTVSVDSPSYSNIYDSNTITSLVSANHYLYLSLTAPASVGEYNVSSTDIIKEVSIKDGNGNDILNNYDISSITYSGKITVQAGSIPSTVTQPTNKEVVYDATLHTLANDFEDVIDYLNSQTVDIEYYINNSKVANYSTFKNTSYQNVGTYKYEIRMNAVNIPTSISATLTIKQRAITLSNTAKSLDKVYDGTATFDSSKLTDEYIQVNGTQDVTGYSFASLGLTLNYSEKNVGASLVASITNTNYTLTSYTLNGTITKKDLTIAVGTYEATYNRKAQNIKILTGYVSGLVSGDTISGELKTSYIDVGSYDLSTLDVLALITTGQIIIVDSIDDAMVMNYSVSVTGTLKINKATLKIVASDLTKTYNAQSQGATITHTYPSGMSFVAGDYTVKYNGATALPINAGSYPITIEVNSNFVLDYTASSLVINKKQITAIAVGNQIVSVGNPTCEVTYYKAQVGDLVLDNHNLTLTLTAPASVGEYNVSLATVTKSIVIKDGSGNDLLNNYDISSITYSGEITVQADSMPSDITRPTDAEVIYDGNLHTLANDFDAVISYLNSQTVDIEYYINNSKVADYSTFKNTSYQNVGTYKYEIRMNAVNIPTSISATLTIKQRAITLSNTAKSLDKVYDGTATFDSSKLTTEYIQVNNIVSGHSSQDLGLTLSYSGKNVGASLIASITNTNYTLTSYTLNGTITKKDLTIAVGTYEATYNRKAQNIKILTGYVSGLVSGDIISGELKTSYIDVGSYDLSTLDVSALITTGQIIIVDSIDDAMVMNYSVSVTGTLKINKATLKIVASDLSKTYNANGQGATITHTYPSGMSFVAGDYTVKYNGATTLPINAGSYPITIEVSSNFALDYTTSSLVINKKQITAIAVGNQTVSVDNPVYSNIYDSDTVTSLVSANHYLYLSLTAPASVGEYDVSLSTVTKEITIKDGTVDILGNYDISSITYSGKITVQAGSIPSTVTQPTNKEVVYDGNLHTLANDFDAVISYLNSQTVAIEYYINNSKLANYSTFKNTSYQNVGTYKYEIRMNAVNIPTSISATLTIKQRAITLSNTAKSLDKVYDGTTTFDSSKLTNEYIQVNGTQDVTGYSFASLGLTLSYSGKNVGASLTASITNTNYTLTSYTLNGTITKKDLTIAVGTYEATYNRKAQNIKILTGYVSGLVSGDIISGELKTSYIDVGSYDLSTLDVSVLITTGQIVIVDSIDDAMVMNYSVSVTGTLKINKATLKIVASDLTKTYNANGQGATITHTYPTGMSFVAGDYTVKYNGATTLPINAGSYPITIEVSSNFALDYTASSLVINKKQITAIAVGNQIVSVCNPTCEVTYYKAQVADLVLDNHNLTLKLTAPASVGEYNVSLATVTKSIVIKDASGSDLTNNYDISSITYSGKITVQADAISSDITLPKDLEVVYDGQNHSLASSFAEVITYLESQTVAIKYYIGGAEVTKSNFSSMAYSNVGSYEYEIRMNAVNIPESISATLTIKQKTISVSNTAQKITKVYDSTTSVNNSFISETYIKVETLATGDSFEDLNISLVYENANVISTNGVIVSLNNANYVLSNNRLDAEITKKNANIDLGENVVTFTSLAHKISLSDSMTSDLYTDAGHSLSGSVTYLTNTNVSATSYTITNSDLDMSGVVIGNGGLANYNLIFTGKILIKAQVIDFTYTAQDLTKEYNAKGQTASLKVPTSAIFTSSDYKITYDGSDSKENVGVYTIKITMLNPNFLFSLNGSGEYSVNEDLKFEITKKKIQKINVSEQIIYLPERLNKNIKVLSAFVTTLADESQYVQISLSVNTNLINVYDINNAYISINSILVYNSESTDITNNYDVTNIAYEGTIDLQKDKLPADISLKNEYVVFDGSEHTISNISEVTTKLEGIGLTNWTISYNDGTGEKDNNKVVPKFVNAGKYQVIIYLHSADPLYPQSISGSIEIGKRNIKIVKITTNNFDKVYDGQTEITSLSGFEIKTTNDSLEEVNLREVVSSHTLTIVGSYSSTEVGNVTANFEIQGSASELSNYIVTGYSESAIISQKEVILNPSSRIEDYYYSGRAYTAHLSLFDASGLLAGHTVSGSVTFTNIITAKVHTLNSSTVFKFGSLTIKNGEETINSANYSFKFSGNIEIKKAVVKVTNWTYDGEALKSSYTYDNKIHTVNASLEIDSNNGVISATNTALNLSFNFKDNSNNSSINPLEKLKDSGTWTVTASLNDEMKQNYEISSGSEVVIVVNKYALTISLNDEQINQDLFRKEYSQADRELIISSYFVEATDEIITNIALERETGEDIGSYDVSLDADYTNNNYDITIEDGEDKFTIIRLTATLYVEIKDSNLLKKVYDGEKIGELLNIDLPYDAYVEKGTLVNDANIEFRKILFVGDSANHGDYAFDIENCVLYSDRYGVIKIASSPYYTIEKRNVIIENNFDKIYDSTTNVDTSSLKVYDYTSGSKGDEIEKTSKYYPTLCLNYKDKNVANNIEILTTINSNFILNGTYSGNISKRDVTIAPRERQTSVYGDSLLIEYDLKENGVIDNTFKAEMSLQFKLVQGGNEVKSSAGEYIAGTHKIALKSVEFDNFNVTIEEIDYVITQKHLTVKGEITKEYDGYNNFANISALTLEGVLTNDKVDIQAVSYEDEQIGINKTVSFVISGDDSVNYVTDDGVGSIITNVLTLKFDYKLDTLFNSNLIVGNATSFINVNYGDMLDESKLPTPTHIGYTLIGWTLDGKTLDDTYRVYSPNWEPNVKERTAIAVWEINYFEVELVYLDDTDSEKGGSVNFIDTNTNKKSFAYNTQIDILAKDAGNKYIHFEYTENEGYYFVDIKSSNKDDFTPFNIYEDTTLYYNFDQYESKLTLHSGIGEFVFNTSLSQSLKYQGWNITSTKLEKIIKYHDTVDLKDIVPIKSGYTFIGWDNAKLNSSFVWKTSQDVVSTAEFKADKFMIILDAKDGYFDESMVDDSIWTKEFDKDSNLKKISKEVQYDAEVGDILLPIRIGFTFDKYLIGATSYSETELESLVWKETGSLTFIATWIENEYNISIGSQSDKSDYKVTIYADNGSVIKNEDISDTKTIVVRATNKVVIIAVMEKGYVFKEFNVTIANGYTVDSLNNKFTIDSYLNVVEDITVYAVYDYRDNKITVKTNSNLYGNAFSGTLTTDNEKCLFETYAKTESTFSFTVREEEGYILDDVRVTFGDSASLSENSGVYTLSNFIEDITVEVTFEKKPLTVVIKSNDATKGLFTYNSDTTANVSITTYIGERINFTVIENYGYSFDRIEVKTDSTNKGTLTQKGLEVVFSDYSSDCELEIYFTINKYVIAPKVVLKDETTFTLDSTGGSVKLLDNNDIELGSSVVEYLTSLKIVATANEGYHFVGFSSDYWRFNNEYNGLKDVNVINNVLTFKVYANQEVFAIFEINSYKVTFEAGANGTFADSNLKYDNYIKHGSILILEDIRTYPNLGYKFEKWVEVVDDRELDIIFSGADNNELVIVKDRHFKAIFIEDVVNIQIYAKVKDSDVLTNKISDKTVMASLNVDTSHANYLSHTDAEFDADEKITAPLKIESKTTYVVKINVVEPVGYVFDSIEVLVGDCVYEYKSNVLTLKNFDKDFTISVVYRAKEYNFEIVFADKNGESMNDYVDISLDETNEAATFRYSSGKYYLNTKYLAIPVLNIYTKTGSYFDGDSYEATGVTLTNTNITGELPSLAYSFGRTYILSIDFASLEANKTTQIKIYIDRVEYDITFNYNFPFGSELGERYTASLKYGDKDIYDLSADRSRFASPANQNESGRVYRFIGWTESPAAELNTIYYFDSTGIYHIEEGSQTRIYGWYGSKKSTYTDYAKQSLTLYAMWELVTHNIYVEASPLEAVNKDVLVRFTDMLNIRYDGKNIYATENASISLIIPEPIDDRYEFIGYVVTALDSNVEIVAGRSNTLQFTMPAESVKIVYNYQTRVQISALGEGSVSINSSTDYKATATIYSPLFDEGEGEIIVRAKSNRGYEIYGFNIAGENISSSTGVYEISYNADNTQATLIIKKLDKSLNMLALFRGKNVNVRVNKAENGYIETIKGTEITYADNFVNLEYRVGDTLALTYKCDYGFKYDGLLGIGNTLSVKILPDNLSGLVLTPMFSRVSISFAFIMYDGETEVQDVGIMVNPKEKQTESYLFGSLVELKWKASIRYQFASKITLNGQDLTFSNNTAKIDTQTDKRVSLTNVNYIRIYFEKIYWITEGEALVKSNNLFVGDGTQTNPYVISNAQHLAALAYLVNIAKDEHYTVAYYKLANGINIEERFWIPIGTKENPFNGTFSFGSNKVSNIVLDKEYSPIHHEGLFGYLGPNARFIQEEVNKKLVFIVVGSIIGLIIVIIVIMLTMRAIKKSKYEKMRRSF